MIKLGFAAIFTIREARPSKIYNSQITTILISLTNPNFIKSEDNKENNTK
jgi:hypothetical protein